MRKEAPSPRDRWDPSGQLPRSWPARSRSGLSVARRWPLDSEDTGGHSQRRAAEGPGREVCGGLEQPQSEESSRGHQGQAPSQGLLGCCWGAVWEPPEGLAGTG